MIQITFEEDESGAGEVEEEVGCFGGEVPLMREWEREGGVRKTSWEEGGKRTKVYPVHQKGCCSYIHLPSFSYCFQRKPIRWIDSISA